jgi:predicted MFS family arabinose efflux permease
MTVMSLKIERSAFRSIFTVLLCAIVLLLNNGFMIVGKAFFDPIVIDNLGISVGTLKFGETITYTTVALAAPAAGYLMDRVGPRALFSVGLGLMAFGLVFYANAGSIELLYIADAMFGLCLALSGCYAGVMIVSEVTDKHRGGAIGFLLAVGNLGNGIAPAANSVLSHAFGWRAALYIIAVITALLIPVVATFIPRSLKRMRASDERNQGKPTLSSTLASANFWYLSGVAAIGFMVSIGLFSNMVLFLYREVHMSAVGVSVFLMVMYFAGFFSQLAAGFCGDLVGYKILDIVCILFMSVGCATFVMGSEGCVWAGMILLSCGWGGHYVLLQNFLPRLFAGPSFGRIVGAVALIEAIGASAGPFSVGLSFDLTSSYRLSFLIGAGLLLVTAFLATGIVVSSRQSDAAAAPASG